MTGVSASAKYIKVMSLFTPGQHCVRSQDDAHHKALQQILRRYYDVTLISQIEGQTLSVLACVV